MLLETAERPSYRKKYAKDLKTTNVFTKNLKNLPHRRRRDGDECMHTIRANSAGLGIGLGRTGRTIYGVGEASGVIRRQRRRNVGRPGLTSASTPSPRTSQGGLTPTQLAVIKVGEEIARREAEMRRMRVRETRKKGDHTCGHGHMKQTGDDMSLGIVGRTGGELVGAEEVAHADRYFDMYINAEAWAGN
ncbi:hypothetical protein BJV74DRAFT_436021 [Russula compacta]|nr:hypothetical protein BJV74DRAFT_436021 [Russula compacta]